MESKVKEGLINLPKPNALSMLARFTRSGWGKNGDSFKEPAKPEQHAASFDD